MECALTCRLGPVRCRMCQVWDVKSTIAQGRPVLLHRCPVEPFGKHNFFKWSHDDKYVAIGKSKYLRSPETGEVSDPWPLESQE